MFPTLRCSRISEIRETTKGTEELEFRIQFPPAESPHNYRFLSGASSHICEALELFAAEVMPEFRQNAFGAPTEHLSAELITHRQIAVPDAASPLPRARLLVA